MNPKIERCIDCTTQCTTQIASDRIVKDYQDGRLADQVDIKFRVSVMSQAANKIGCPDTEINRIRRITAEAVGIGNHIRNAPRTFSPSGLPIYDGFTRIDPRRRPGRL